MNEEKIDFVITWVDGNDKSWQKEKKKYENKEESNLEGSIDNSENRYRDWGNLKYLFRGIEKFAPWVNNVYFITCNQIPEWMNCNAPKLKLINHEDYIPKEYLPTFNSNAIEINLFRLKELSNNFVLFNDDMFLLKKVSPKDFFKDGKPCDSGIMSPIISYNKDGFAKVNQNNMAIINTYFEKNKVIKKNISKWFNLKYGISLFRNFCLMPWNHFPGFYDLHLPYSCQKDIFKKLWDKETRILEETAKSKFRNNSTNINHWLFRYWNLVTGNFVPRSPKFGYKFQYDSNNDQIYNAIKKQKYKTICLNDVSNNYDFETEKKKTIEAFEKILPEKSCFEK